MTGDLPMSTRSEPLKNYLAKDRISGFNDDKWKQLPALTRSQMICSLRYRDEHSKLSKIPPPSIVLWSRMIGSWPSVMFGGSRFALQAQTMVHG